MEVNKKPAFWDSLADLEAKSINITASFLDMALEIYASCPGSS
jgi:hypothetical protein